VSPRHLSVFLIGRAEAIYEFADRPCDLSGTFAFVHLPGNSKPLRFGKYAERSARNQRPVRCTTFIRLLHAHQRWLQSSPVKLADAYFTLDRSFDDGANSRLTDCTGSKTSHRALTHALKSQARVMNGGTCLRKTPAKPRAPRGCKENVGCNRSRPLTNTPIQETTQYPIKTPNQTMDVRRYMQHTLIVNKPHDQG